jgi:sec-independent protein translocase protein TatB
MFDIGFWELVILFGLGLMVLGPERMPRVAAQLGRWAGQARSMARNLTRQIRDEIEPLETMKSNLDKTMDTDFSARRPEPGQHTQSSDDATSETSTDEPDKNS